MRWRQCEKCSRWQSGAGGAGGEGSGEGSAVRGGMVALVMEAAVAAMLLALASVATA